MGFRSIISVAVCMAAVAGCRHPAGMTEVNRLASAGRQHAEEPFEVARLPRAQQSADRPPELTEESTLQDYLAYAALNSPELRAAFHRWRAALEKIPQARAFPDPKLTYGHYIREVETRVGPQRQKVGISQMFPWFGKLRLRGDVAAEAAKAAQQRYEAVKLALFSRVKHAYAEYYYLWRATSVTKENTALLKYLEQVARARYKVAAAGHPDVIKAQVELGKLEDRLRSLRDLRGAAAAKLNAALGRDPEAPVPWPQSLPAERIAASDQELLLRLREVNPELMALKFTIKKERKSVRLARKQYYPDVTLAVNYIDTGSARMPGTDESGKDPVVAGIAINLPVWRHKYAAGVREALQGVRTAQSSLRARQFALESEAKLAAYGVRDAERKMNLYLDTLIPKAKQSLKATEAAFKGGKTGFLDLIDAQRMLLEFQLAYERAFADHVQHLAQLEMLVGEEIPRGEPPEARPAPGGPENGERR